MAIGMNEPTSRAAAAKPARNFGQRREATTIVISGNGRNRTINISPLVVSIAFSIAMTFSIGYFAATAYLVFHDDLVTAAMAHNARLRHEYEDRIANLRANLDRVTSRQLLDQQAIETRIAELMNRQAMLGGREGKLGELIERARENGVKTGEAAPRQETDPQQTGSISGTSPVFASAFALRGSTLDERQIEISPLSESLNIGNDTATHSLFSDVSGSIAAIETAQIELVEQYRSDAAAKAGRIAGALRGLRVSLPKAAKADTALGGPFIALGREVSFQDRIEALGQSLDALESLKKVATVLPLGNPARGHSVSSSFGARSDPFLGTAALHSGIDFRAPQGEPVAASARGTVIHAGPNGGYGNLVEMDHGNGFTTRYAHLSRILVKKGDKVVLGAIVGKVGSTGRSTGPHLHYEVRRNDKPVNPAPWLKAGKEIGGA